ncbi:hypothetical protein E2C01_024893 [Portunus trituberculatus]|uniref:Uncharacterized protein n=1 Tax=Portunus trituberculatus TaxID=210409 RepID=A0A5B7EE29_PORTR|nr:hypothetical protein [Portunus trituberculatus]
MHKSLGNILNLYFFFFFFLKQRICITVIICVKTLLIYHWNPINSLNPFSNMTRFHIRSAYYLMILYSFRNSCGRLK